VIRIPGLYVLGLAYQSRRGSHFIGGVGRDAESIARSIVARRGKGKQLRTSLAAA
jgi:putative flavoprotein involved in K+ transport